MKLGLARELVRTISEAFKDIEIMMSYRDGPGDTSRPLMNIEKAEKPFGWETGVSSLLRFVESPR